MRQFFISFYARAFTGGRIKGGHMKRDDMKNDFSRAEINTQYSYFTNEYTLTKEMCAELEPSRIDLGFIFVGMTIIFMFMVLLPSVSDMIPAIPDAAHAFFSTPSVGTILEFSGVTGITFVPPLVAIWCLIKAFPKLVGEKQFKEHMKLVPGVNRTVSFYDTHVTVKGKFSKKLPYKELRRIGETRNYYILYFTEKIILPVDKAGFRKGNLKELKEFLRERRTWKSKVFGVARYLPSVILFVFYCYMLWTEGL